MRSFRSILFLVIVLLGFGLVGCGAEAGKGGGDPTYHNGLALTSPGFVVTSDDNKTFVVDATSENGAVATLKKVRSAYPLEDGDTGRAEDFEIAVDSSDFWGTKSILVTLSGVPAGATAHIDLEVDKPMIVASDGNGGIVIYIEDVDKYDMWSYMFSVTYGLDLEVEVENALTLTIDESEYPPVKPVEAPATKVNYLEETGELLAVFAVYPDGTIKVAGVAIYPVDITSVKWNECDPSYFGCEVYYTVEASTIDDLGAFQAIFPGVCSGVVGYFTVVVGTTTYYVQLADMNMGRDVLMYQPNNTTLPLVQVGNPYLAF